MNHGRTGTGGEMCYIRNHLSHCSCLRKCKFTSYLFFILSSLHVYSLQCSPSRIGGFPNLLSTQSVTTAVTKLQPATPIPPQPSHTETSTHIETRTHNQCGDTIEKSQAPDDSCINVRNMLSTEEVK